MESMCDKMTRAATENAPFFSSDVRAKQCGDPLH